MILTALFVYSSAATANEITLKTSIVVEGQYITLGDFFGISDEKGLKPIAHSPRPGRTATFNAVWLYRIARSNKINWRPISRNTQVIVERASQEIYPDEIEDALISSLRKKGITGEFELAYSGRLRKLHVASDQSATVGIEYLNYSSHTGRFTASLAAPVNNPSAQRLRITGRVHKLTTIPVINKRLHRGRVIGGHDIEWLKVRVSTLRKDVVVNEEDLIGMAAKRTIRKSSPIKFSHIGRPILVTKGGLVTISLTTPSMRLTAQGKSLQAGSKGDTVQIKNLQSKQTIEAKVTGTNEVRVALTNHAALN